MTLNEKEYFEKAGFTKEQIEKISEGKKAGLNTAVYANKNYLPIQMHQIMLGLMDQLPVEQYAKPEYDWFQMEEIRKGLKSGVDVSVYSSPDISYEKMRQLRKGLEEGINLYSYAKFEANIIRELRKAKTAGVNILKYINMGCDAEQLSEIRYALEKNIDLDPYLSVEYRAASLTEIRKGLERGIDVSEYAKIYYNWRQMREIRKGLEGQIDITKYNSRFYSWEQMREIRLGLEQGLDVEEYRLLRYTANEMHKKRISMLEVLDEKRRKIMESQIQTQDFKFEFMTDDMEVYATLLTRDKEISEDRLMDILNHNGICKGIQSDAIREIIEGKSYKKALLIAKGQIPHKGEDGYYEFFFRTNLQRKPKILEDGTADYKNIEWFEMVKEGQKLAEYHEAKDGVDGYNVRGNVLKARKGVEQRILRGQGFRIEEDKKTYTATLDGMIKLDGNEMHITNHMLLDEINMTTGNVEFEGSIHVIGDVGAGVVVKAAGDIVIDGNVESATLESDGSIILKKGMNPAGRGIVKAKHDVISRFFESVKVEAGGNIEVENCLNSQLYAEGVVRSNGTIAGGVVRAGNGFRVRNVGNQAGIHTVLQLKAGDGVWEENRMIKKAIQESQAELQMLNHSYEEFKLKFPPEIRDNLEIFKKVEKAVFSKKKQLEQLEQIEEETEKKLKQVSEARVVISGRAHEGTTVDVDGYRWQAADQWNVVLRREENQLEVIIK